MDLKDAVSWTVLRSIQGPVEVISGSREVGFRVAGTCPFDGEARWVPSKLYHPNPTTALHLKTALPSLIFAKREEPGISVTYKLQGV